MICTYLVGIGALSCHDPFEPIIWSDAPLNENASVSAITAEASASTTVAHSDSEGESAVVGAVLGARIATTTAAARRTMSAAAAARRTAAPGLRGSTATRATSPAACAIATFTASTVPDYSRGSVAAAAVAVVTTAAITTGPTRAATVVRYAPFPASGLQVAGHAR
jgi:hypothetical protein